LTVGPLLYDRASLSVDEAWPNSKTPLAEPLLAALEADGNLAVELRTVSTTRGRLELDAIIGGIGEAAQQTKRSSTSVQLVPGAGDVNP